MENKRSIDFRLAGMDEKQMDKVKVFRRRQFALGPEHLNLEGWKRYYVAEHYCLTVHPDLSVNEVHRASRSIILLGYIIDPYHPESNETEIISAMVDKINSVDDVAAYLEWMSGRFVLIVRMNSNNNWLFHDAVGLRQVLYCRDEHGRIWCASQAETLAERLRFSMDEEVIKYYNSPMFKEGRCEFWLINNRTPYKEILHLLPNHYLDLKRGEAIRFWPTKNCIASLSVDEGVRLSVPILRKSIEAVSRKFEVKMGITAGLDSRRTLAATKDLKEKILYFTLEHDLCGIDSANIKVPGQLLPKIGIQHYVLNRKVMSDDFRNYYEANATLARVRNGNIAYMLFYHFGIDVFVMNSNLSEISQCNYWLPKSKINGQGLAIITGLYHPLAIKEFDKWIQDARIACENSGVNILGLFRWEQRGGRWAAAAFSEYDIAHESFTPYSNRYLIKVLMGISERYRRDRMRHVPLRQIQYMWPEVLSEPINPGSAPGERLREFLRRKVLHKYVTPWVPIYEYCRFWVKRKRMEKNNTI